MSRVSPAALLLSLAAAIGCGGDGGGANLPDGALAPDAGGDGGTLDCRREADDNRNGGEPEPTGLTFAGRRVAICGAIAADQANGDLVDRDMYQVTVAPAASVVVRLIAPLAGEVERMELRVRDASGLRALARVRAANAISALLLPQGEYTLEVEARAAAAQVPVPYRIELYADDPALRCPPMAGGTIHAERDESEDGHRANDVIEARGQPPILDAQMTSSTGDVPDPTGQAVTAGDRFTIAGESAAVPSTGDAYHDRDTFSLYTGATTNQLDIRTVWTGGLADLDVLVFEANDAGEPMGTPSAAIIGEEIVVTAVEPSTAYWLWVGGSMRSSSLPVTYAVHVCGREIPLAPIAD